MTRDVRVTLALVADEASQKALQNKIRNGVRDAVKAGLSEGFSGSGISNVGKQFGQIDDAAKKSAAEVRKLSDSLESLSKIKPSGNPTLDKITKDTDELNKAHLEGKLSAEQYVAGITNLIRATSQLNVSQSKTNSETKESIKTQQQLARESKAVADAMLRLAKAAYVTTEGNERLANSEVELVTAIRAKKASLEALVSDYNQVTASQAAAGDETGELATRIQELQTEMSELAHSIVADEAKIEQAITESNNAIKEKIALEKQLTAQSKVTATTILKLAKANQELFNGTVKVSEADVITIRLIQEKKAELTDLTNRYTRLGQVQDAAIRETIEYAAEMKQLQTAISRTANEITKYEDDLLSVINTEKKAAAQAKKAAAEEKAATALQRSNANALANEINRLASAQERASNGHEINKINVLEEARAYLVNKQAIRDNTLALEQMQANLIKAGASQDKVKNDTRELRGEIDRLTASVAKYDARIRSAGAAGGLSGILGSFSAGFFRAQAVILALTQIGQALQFVTTQLTEGAAVLQTRESFFTIAGSGADALLADVRRASSGLLAENDLLRVGTALIAGTTGELRASLGGSADELVTIARAAIKANPAVSDRYGGLEGVTSRLVEGIRKQEVELFDEFRIIVRLGEAVKEYAEANDKSAASLTNVERQQAFLNSVLREGNVLVNQLNGDLSSQADAYTLLGTKLLDLKTTTQAYIAEALLPMVKLLSGTYSQNAADFVNTRGIAGGGVEDTIIGLGARIEALNKIEVPEWLSIISGRLDRGIRKGVLELNDFGEAIELLLTQVNSESAGDLEKFIELLSGAGADSGIDIGANFAPELARELAVMANSADEFFEALDQLGVKTNYLFGMKKLGEELELTDSAQAGLNESLLENLELQKSGNITREEAARLNREALFLAIQLQEVGPIDTVIPDYLPGINAINAFNEAVKEQSEIAAKAALVFSDQYAKSFTTATEEILKNKEGLDAWAVSAVNAAINQGATSDQIGELGNALEVFTEEEYAAIVATANFEAGVAQLISQGTAAGTSFETLAQQIAVLADEYGIAAIEQDKLLRGLEEASAAKYESVFKNTLDDILDSKTGMEEWVTTLREVIDEAGLNSQQIIALATDMGRLSDSEIAAAKNAAEFESELAKLIGTNQILNPSFDGVGDAVLKLAADFNVAARAASYFSEAQRGAFLQGFLTQSPTVDRNVARGFSGGLIRPSGGGGGGGSATAKKEADAIAAQFVSLLEDITKDGIEEFRDKLISTEDGLSGLEKSLLNVAVAGGASVSQIRALTEALGNGEDAAEAFRALAAEKGIERIVEQFLGGDLSAEQAAEGVRLLNEQLAAGEDIDLSSLGIDLDSVATGVKAVNEAVGGGGGGTTVRNWLDELVASAEQAGAGIDVLSDLARKAGFTEEQIMSSLEDSLLSEAVAQLGSLAADAGGDIAANLLTGFQQSLGDATTVDEMAAVGEAFFNEIDSYITESNDLVNDWKADLLSAGVDAGLSTQTILELAKAQDDYNESALTASLRTEAMRVQVETLVKKLKEGVPVADVLGEQAKFDKLLGDLQTAESIAVFIDNLVTGMDVQSAFENAADGVVNRIKAGTKPTLEDIGKTISNIFSEKQEMDIEIDDKKLMNVIKNVAVNEGDGYELLLGVEETAVRKSIESALSAPFLIAVDIRAEALSNSVSNALSAGAKSVISNIPEVPQAGRQKRALGGPIYGPSHTGGGVNINAEGGEYIIPRWMATPEFIADLERVRLSNSRNIPMPSVSMTSVNSQMVSVPSVNNSSSTSISSSADRTSIVNNYYYGAGDTQRVARPTLTELSGQ